MCVKCVVLSEASFQGTPVINLSHRLNLSPRSSLNQIGVNERTKEYVPVSGNDLDENFNLPPSPVGDGSIPISLAFYFL